MTLMAELTCPQNCTEKRVIISHGLELVLEKEINTQPDYHDSYHLYDFKTHRITLKASNSSSHLGTGDRLLRGPPASNLQGPIFTFP